MSSGYIKREHLSNLVDTMLSVARKSKNRVSTTCLLPSNQYYWSNEYWYNYVNKVDRSIEHFCDTAGVFIDLGLKGTYTVKQLEVLKFILSLRRNNGSQVL